MRISVHRQIFDRRTKRMETWPVVPGLSGPGEYPPLIEVSGLSVHAIARSGF